MLHEVNFPIYSVAVFFWEKKKKKEKSAERRVPNLLSTLRDTDRQSQGGMSGTTLGRMSEEWPKPSKAPQRAWLMQDDAPAAAAS